MFWAEVYHDNGHIFLPFKVMYQGKEYSVTSIGDWAFNDCRGLISMTCKANNSPEANKSFGDDVDYSIPFFVPKESIEI